MLMIAYDFPVALGRRPELLRLPYPSLRSTTKVPV